MLVQFKLKVFTTWIGPVLGLCLSLCWPFLMRIPNYIHMQSYSSPLISTVVR